MTILVAGGTGRLGEPLVAGLVAAGRRVRVLTRSRDHALPDAVERCIGDVRDPDAIARAVADTTTVISAIHGFVGPGRTSPEAIDRDANRALVAASVRAGVARFVLVSVHGAASDHPMSLHRAKHAAEACVRASGIPFAIVRPTAFLETWLEVIGGGLAAKGEALVFGPGTNPINFVAVRDVADAVVAAALAPPGAASSDRELGGPENLSFVAVAERLIAAHGGGRIKHVPLPVLRAMAILARPFAPTFARMARAAVVMNTRDMTFAVSA